MIEPHSDLQVSDYSGERTCKCYSVFIRACGPGISTCALAICTGAAVQTPKRNMSFSGALVEDGDETWSGFFRSIVDLNLR